MDMMRTNGSTQRQWADRPLSTDALQGSDKGVALEYLIDLANQTRANDYVQKAAELIRDQLDEELEVYVEYSNEVWNAGFEQYNYAESMGRSAGLGSDRDAADGYYCRRSVEIRLAFIIEDIFGVSSKKGAEIHGNYLALGSQTAKDEPS